jgi:sugar O-acyltransferase (sialic acid O-acetyltransferase NeuD family)
MEKNKRKKKLNKIILFGNGGQAKVVTDTLRFLNTRVLFNIYKKNNKNVASNDLKNSNLKKIIKKFSKMKFHIAIGDNSIRKKIYNSFSGLIKFQVVISKYAWVSKKSIIGEGTYISEGAIVKKDTEIGKNCLLNTACIIEHDCKIGNNVNVGPGAIICGNVHISNNVSIGAGAIVVNNVKVSKKKFISAGKLIKNDC